MTKKVKAIKITDPRKLPKLYMVVPEYWEEMIENRDKKLRDRGMMVKRPFELYALTRKTYPGEELCIALEKI